MEADALLLVSFASEIGNVEVDALLLVSCASEIGNVASGPLLLVSCASRLATYGCARIALQLFVRCVYALVSPPPHVMRKRLCWYKVLRMKCVRGMGAGRERLRSRVKVQPNWPPRRMERRSVLSRVE